MKNDTPYGDAMTAAPEVHSVMFENDKVRVLKAVLNPGQKAKMHWHPEYTLYVIKPGKLRFTLPDGSINEKVLNEGEIVFSSGAHEVDNIGESKVELIATEIKV